MSTPQKKSHQRRTNDQASQDTTPGQVIQELLDLQRDLLVPFMKVRRDVPFPTEHHRQETDGEHAFSLSMLAITLNERLTLGLDNGLLAQLSLVHDLVEAYAGDVSQRTATEKDLTQKKANEHAALLKISTQFATSAPWIAHMIKEYEMLNTPEARFVNALDKFTPAMMHIAADGYGWNRRFPLQNEVLFKQIRRRLRQRVEIFPALLEYFDYLFDMLDKNRPHYATLDPLAQKHIHYIRHGQSQANADELWAGSLDTPLTTRGHEQAKRAAADIKSQGLAFDVIVSSPQQRALHTAQHVADAINYPHDRILVTELARERSFGVLEGTVHKEASAAYLLDESGIDHFEGVESLMEANMRAAALVEFIAQLPDERILVVAHGSFGRAFRRALHNLPHDFRGERFENATIVKLQ